jgi:hypothetical protein
MDSRRARDDLDDFMETIDLTFSSPEPDPQPRPRPQLSTQSRPPPRPAPRTQSKQPTQSLQSAQPWQSTQPRQFTQQTPRPQPVPTHVRTPINSSSGIQVGGGYDVHHQSTQRAHASASQYSLQPTVTRNKAPAAQPGPSIDPQHLVRILESCDVRALRYVLLNLCKTSPALSGAVARGLAPYSVFAQAIIKGQQRQPHHGSGSRTQSTTPRTQPAPDSSSRMRSTAPRTQPPFLEIEEGNAVLSSSLRTQSATPQTQPTSLKAETGTSSMPRSRSQRVIYDPVVFKNESDIPRWARPGGNLDDSSSEASDARPDVVSASALTGREAPLPDHIQSPAPRRADGTHISTPHPPAFSIQHEREGSPTDSDNSEHIVSLSNQRGPENRMPLKPASSNLVSLSSSTPFQQHGSTRATPAAKPHVCLRCEKTFTEEERRECIYHKGTIEESDDGIRYWNCCGDDMSSEGCHLSAHVNEKEACTPPPTRPVQNAPYRSGNKRRRLE